MVIPSSSSSLSPRLSPRLQLAKSGSWRKYVKVPSIRKLEAAAADPPIIVEQRRVRFNEESNIIETIPLPDIKINEAKWYKKSDYELFEKDRQLTALEYRTRKKNGRPYIEREHSVRGLEELCDTSNGAATSSSPTTITVLHYPPFQSSSSSDDDYDDDDDDKYKDNNNDTRRHPPSHRGTRARTTTRSEHLKKVLAEQTRQRVKGVYPNTTMLREISCKSSKESRQKSAQLGEADALAGYVSSSRSLQRQVAGVMHNVSRKLQA